MYEYDFEIPKIYKPLPEHVANHFQKLKKDSSESFNILSIKASAFGDIAFEEETRIFVPIMSTTEKLLS